jgi:protoheme ferro-lyase
MGNQFPNPFVTRMGESYTGTVILNGRRRGIIFNAVPAFQYSCLESFRDWRFKNADCFFCLKVERYQYIPALNSRGIILQFSIRWFRLILMP